MSSLNEPPRLPSPNPKKKSHSYPPVKEETSLDQNAKFKSPSTAGSTNLEAATCREKRPNPEEEHSRLKRELSIAGWSRDFDPSTSSEELLNTITASSHVLQRESRWPRTKEREAVLLFEELHMLNIRQHELRLLDFSRCLKQPVGDELHQTLSGYRHALDDFEAIRGLSPSALTKEGGLSTYLQGRGICIKSVGQQTLERQQQALQSAIDQLLYSSIQFSFAAAGGLLLLVPLLIMVYVPGRTASVVTTCVAVSVFAVQLAVWSSMAHLVEISDLRLFRFLRGTGLRFGSFEPKDIIGVTAAYAAVLVVFVGTSTSPG